MASLCIAREIAATANTVLYILSPEGDYQEVLEPPCYGSLYENLFWLCANIKADYVYFCASDVHLDQSAEKALLQYFVSQRPGQLYALDLQIVDTVNSDLIMRCCSKDARCAFDLKLAQLILPIPLVLEVLEGLVAVRYNYRCTLFGEQLLQAGLQKAGVRKHCPVNIKVSHAGKTRGMLATRCKRARSLVAATIISFELGLLRQFLWGVFIKSCNFVRPFV